MLLGRHERWIFELECESVEAAEIWVERRIQELPPRLRCSSSIGVGVRGGVFTAPRVSMAHKKSMGSNLHLD